MEKIGFIGVDSRHMNAIETIVSVAEPSIYNDLPFTEEKVHEFIASSDKIVLRSGYLPKHLLGIVPVERTLLVPTAMEFGKVVTFIRQGKFDWPGEVSTEHSRVHETLPLDWVISGMDPEVASDYVPMTTGIERPVIMPGPDGMFSHQLLLAASPGDTFRYHRVPGRHTPFESYVKFLSAQYHYGATVGYVIESHVFEHYTDLFVTSRRQDSSSLRRTYRVERREAVERAIYGHPSKAKAPALPINSKEQHMKVGIIGVAPRQRQNVIDLNLAVQLFWYDDERFTRNSITTFADKVDDLIVLAKHAPKPAIQYAPRGKLHVIAGNVGISGVTRYLTGKYPVRPEPKVGAKVIQVQKVVVPEPVKAVSVPAPVQEVKVAIQAPSTTGPAVVAVPRSDWRLSMVDGKQQGTSYRASLLADDAPRLIPGPSGRYNHSLLEAALPGDVVRYARRVNDDDTSIKGLFNYVFREYSKRLGLAFEIHIYEQFVDVYVTARPVDKKAPRHFVSIISRTVFQDYLNGLANVPDAGDKPPQARQRRSQDQITRDSMDPTVFDCAATMSMGLTRQPGGTHSADIPLDPADVQVGAALPLTVSASEAAHGFQVNGDRESLNQNLVDRSVRIETGRRDEVMHAAGLQVVDLLGSPQASPAPEPVISSDELVAGDRAIEFSERPVAAGHVRLSDEDLAFWKELLVAGVRNGLKVYEASDEADDAVRRLLCIRQDGFDA